MEKSERKHQASAEPELFPGALQEKLQATIGILSKALRLPSGFREWKLYADMDRTQTSYTVPELRIKLSLKANNEGDEILKILESWGIIEQAPPEPSYGQKWTSKTQSENVKKFRYYININKLKEHLNKSKSI